MHTVLVAVGHDVIDHQHLRSEGGGGERVISEPFLGMHICAMYWVCSRQLLLGRYKSCTERSPCLLGAACWLHVRLF